MNEARAFESTRGYLTQEQTEQAIAACYGLSTKKPMAHVNTQSTHQLSPEEIAEFRAFREQTKRAAQGPEAEFDLNKPPQEKYIYQEFPKLVYHHDSKKSIKVNDADELKAAIAAGYQEEAFVTESDVQVSPLAGLSPAERAEVTKLDKIAKQPKK